MTTLIDPQCFAVTRLRALLTNTAGDIAGNSGTPIEVLEVAAQSLIVHGPAGLCALGHHMLIELEAEGHDSTLQFKSTARVSAVGPLSPTELRITLQLLQYDKTTWSRLLALLSGRQDAINGFLKAARGY